MNALLWWVEQMAALMFGNGEELASICQRSAFVNSAIADDAMIRDSRDA
jgi:hypothetical protein